MYIIALFMEFILEKIVFLTPNNSIVHFRKLSHIISIKSFLIVKVYLAGRAPSKFNMKAALKTLPKQPYISLSVRFCHPSVK